MGNLSGVCGPTSAHLCTLILGSNVAVKSHRHASCSGNRLCKFWFHYVLMLKRCDFFSKYVIIKGKMHFQSGKSLFLTENKLYFFKVNKELLEN